MKIGDKVICVSNDGLFVTYGNVYTILDIIKNNDYNYIKVLTDSGDEICYISLYFISIKEIRKRKLKIRHLFS